MIEIELVQYEQQTGIGFELMGCGLLRELMLDANIPGRTALVFGEGARSADQGRLIPGYQQEKKAAGNVIVRIAEILSILEFALYQLKKSSMLKNLKSRS
jgi:hypothetical protein